MTIFKLRNHHFPISSFGPYYENEFTQSSEFVPPTNIKKVSDQYEISMAVPGFEKNQFHIHLDNHVLSISAEIQPSKNQEKNDEFRVIRQEYHPRNFQRKFTLPKNSYQDNISARYENGILSVIVPFENPEKNKVIKSIQVN